jgi:hypothetical protein
MQVGNAAWKEYLKSTLNFSSCQQNLILITAYVLLYLGILSYKYFFISWSWRKVYIFTTALNGFFSILQVCLIYGITFGLSDFLFALGDDAFSDFISGKFYNVSGCQDECSRSRRRRRANTSISSRCFLIRDAGIQFLPTTIMMVHLCPTGTPGLFLLIADLIYRSYTFHDFCPHYAFACASRLHVLCLPSNYTGSEGASYAMFTTVNNSALNLSSAISTQLLRVWDVSKAALAGGELSGLVNLTYLTTFIQVSAIAFVGWLPNFKEDLAALKNDAHRSRIGGAIFLGITFSSIIYSICVGVLNIIAPR